MLTVSSSSAGDLSDALWFHADFDSPTTVAGEVFPFAMPTNFLTEGRFGNGYHFICNPNGRPSIAFNRGDPRNGNCFNTGDSRLLASFPADEGTFACWLKCDSTNAPARCETPLFSYSGWWKRNWTLTSSHFMTSSKRGAAIGRSRQKPLYERRTDWMHVVGTWDREKLALYIDGELSVTNRTVELQRLKSGTLRIGSGMQASGAAEGVMDEISIFRRALTADEVRALFAAKSPLRSRQWLLGGVDFTVFFRNQENAALRTTVFAPAAGRYRVTGCVGPVAVAPVEASVVAGRSPLVVPFDPSRFRPGRYPWRFELQPAQGRPIVREGTLEIRGRLDREAFRFHSWGPDASLDYDRDVGFNQLMTMVGDIDGTRRLIDAGLFVNYRLCNASWWKRFGSDWGCVRDEVRTTFAYAEGLYPWRSTLVNSEVYGEGALAELTNSVPFLAACEKAIGRKPVIAITSRPPHQLDRGRQGKKALRGVFDSKDEPDYATFKWYQYCGHPAFAVNGASREAIRSIDPDNIVWSEPSFGGVASTVDTHADWNYCWSVSDTLREFRTQYAFARPYGAGYQPTLSSGYYHGRPGDSFYPDRTDAKGAPVPCLVTQSADECAVKALCALGAVKTDTLSWFCVKDWSDGEISAADYLAGGTNTYRLIADVGVGKRYGKLMREQVFPKADLLRGMATVRAPVAFVSPFVGWVAGGLGWGHYHYNNAYKTMLAQQPVPYDVLAETELTAENLSQYKVIFLSAAPALEREHFAALRQAAEGGTRIVTDGHCGMGFPNGVALTNQVWNYYRRQTMLDPARAFCREAMPELAKGLGAVSTGDGDTTYTFEKVHKGVRYVVVVNDRRKPHDPADGLLTRFCTNTLYRPYAAPQRIVTTIRNVPCGAAVYEYDGSRSLDTVRRGEELEITADYAPASARVFVVQQCPVKTPELTVAKTAANVATLRVAIPNGRGQPAPGRTVVAVKVTDPEGRVTDESGRYPVENGAAEIPIRFADDDPAGGLFAKWKAEVTDLTTGESAAVGFRR